MKYQLFDYQRDAALGCLKQLRRRRRLAGGSQPVEFALSAITGAGKTVIATAVIEAMLHGPGTSESMPIRGDVLG